MEEWLAEERRPTDDHQVAVEASQAGVGPASEGSEMMEPWQWGDDVALAESTDQSTRGPAGVDLVEALHTLAQRLQWDLFAKEPLTSGPWFAPRWLGIDPNFWMCTLGYQVGEDLGGGQLAHAHRGSLCC